MGRRKGTRAWAGRTASGRRRGRAPSCKKRGFEEYEDAQQHLENYRTRRATTGYERLPLSVQECESCGLFHITGAISKPARLQQMRRRRKGAMGWK